MGNQSKSQYNIPSSYKYPNTRPRVAHAIELHKIQSKLRRLQWRFVLYLFTKCIAMDVWKDVSTRDASRCFIYLKVLVKTMQVRTAMRKEEVEEVIKAENVKDNVLNKLNVVQTLKMHLKNTGKGQKKWKTEKRVKKNTAALRQVLPSRCRGSRAVLSVREVVS